METPPRPEAHTNRKESRLAVSTAGFPLLTLLVTISLFFFHVMMSSNSSCFYCSPKTLGCSVGITKTEIQSVFFSGLRGSGTMGVFVVFSHYWSPARAPGDTQSIWNHPIGRWN